MVTITEKVRFYETDLMGVAHHSNHIRWFECGRCAYFEAAGVDLFKLMDEGIVFPIKSVSCNYLVPIRFADVIRIETRLIKLSRAQVVFSYRLIRDYDDTVLAEGTTQNVFTHQASGKIARLSDSDFRRFQSMYEEDKKAAGNGGMSVG
ncbi:MULTISPECIES: acyl-CoA thioesterase [Megasphaera]|uniref:Acyl-CoA thioester hydrolase, YbgC/YbaW family n=1 Tax=Megasphaera vaginalis (ex Srinivasan et al. 2021) TaxID=1111454 RepID=U7UR47_9FIRM|nr:MULTISPECIES: thioesterase family protein [Megasphaera]ERT61917.1 acyl-CoA thioester hydrolase, YbgC/YbaW family [Megasphaera vaginalis (ex Srinivasan et al. 2021)]